MTRGEPARSAATSGVAGHYCMAGCSIVITTNAPGARRAVEQIFQGFAAPRADPRAAPFALRHVEVGWRLEAPGTQPLDLPTLDSALIALEAATVQDVLARRTDCCHLHGAALRTPSRDRSVLLLGASGTGKTTLALALIARGYAPLADDVILIDPASLLPQRFPRAFHVDESTRALVAALPEAPRWQFDGMPAGYFMPPEWAEDTAPVGAVFFPARSGDGSTALRRLPIAEAAATLVSFSLTLDRRPDLALRVAAGLTAAAPCFTVCSGDLAGTASVISAALAG